MTANEVVIKITSRSEVKGGFEEAKREAESAGGKAAEAYQDKFREKIRGMGMKVKEPMEKAGRDAGETMGGKVSDAFMDKMRRAFSELPARERMNVAEAGRRIGRALADEIEDKTKDIKVFAHGRATVSGIGDRTEHVKVKVDVDVDRESFGARLKAMFRKVIPDSFNSALQSLNGGDLKMALIAGAVAGLAPILGGAIASAVTLALGGGVLASGIALSAKDPKVRSAFGDLKDHLMDRDLLPIQDQIKKAQERFAKAQALGSDKGMASAQYDIDLGKKRLEQAREFNRINLSLRDMAEPAFVGPLTRAFKTMADSVDRMKPSLQEMFNTMGPVLDKLTPGLTGLFENMMPGMVSLAKTAVPLFETLADYLPDIGDALGDFFQKISDHGDETNAFFADLLDAVVMLIDFFGTLVIACLNIYSAMRRAFIGSEVIVLQFAKIAASAMGMVLHAAVIAFGWVPGLGPKLKAAEKKFQDFRQNINAELQRIHDKTVHITIEQSFKMFGKPYSEAGIRSGDIGGLAHGGIARAASGMVAGGLTWVGERGAELVNLPTGATVRSAGDSQRMMRQTMSGHGGNAPTIVISPALAADQPLIRAILNSLRFEIAGQGGNVQTVLGRG